VLGLYPGASDEDKELLRERLLTYFTIVGQAAPEVKKARAHLTSLMF
jgi:thioredoxin-like negative regulator of GroEL